MNPPQTAYINITHPRYGEIKNGIWLAEPKWMTIFVIPKIFNTWVNSLTGKPVTKIYCNKDITTPLANALKNVADLGIINQLKTFDGCFNIRYIRGSTTKMSKHSFGVAIDINGATNKLNTPGDMSDELGGCFVSAGFTWGKHFTRCDPMHMEYHKY